MDAQIVSSPLAAGSAHTEAQALELGWTVAFAQPGSM